MPVDSEKLLEMYKKIILSREMEKMHGKLLEKGEIELMAHFSTGQEAVGVGIGSALRKEDVMFGTHRGVDEYIGKGMDSKNIWKEYFGKKSGLCKGKGTLHLADKDNNIPGMTGCLGSNFSIAVGMALAIKIKKSDNIVVVISGDGTMNQGDVHPSMVMASSWNLPIIFAVVNNKYSEFTYWKEFTPTDNIACRGTAYNIPFEIVDGQRVDKVYESTGSAVEHCRNGKGPYIIEYETYRMALHYSGDPGGYVNEEERNNWGKRDPAEICRNMLLENKIIDTEKDSEILNQIKLKIEEDVKDAINSPDPTIEDLCKDVYEEYLERL
ncbi:MAG: thiamine pyrophosphate-dependent dehydrogenase E1 component subunit alpha [Candidatus Humimicrobiaceae bacterium]